MKKYLLIILISCLTISSFSIAQNISQDKDTVLQDNHLPTIYIGVGLLGFNGNIGSITKMSIYTDSRFGYNAGIDERLWNTGLAIGVNYLGGELSKNERSIGANANFQSNIWSIGMNLTYNLDNGYILSRLCRIAPYITAGIDYLSFKSYADMKDANGNTYYYWNDGTIRSLPQTAINAETAYIQAPDYTYETELYPMATAQGNNYKQTSISIPLGLGIAFKLTPAFSVDIKGTYYMTQTKWIDDASNQNGGSVIGNTKNDAYLYTGVSLRYNIGVSLSSSYEDPRYKDVDFKALLNEDSDGDGVPDIDDKCPGTPKGVKVDRHGCPVKKYVIGENKTLDNNEANYSDSLTTYSLAPVNYVEPDYTNYHPQQKPDIIDTSSTESTNVIKTVNVQSENTIKSIIPDELQIADTNNDGIISVQEINSAIEAFFDGDKRFTVPLINKLVDFFFSQK